MVCSSAEQKQSVRVATQQCQSTAKTRSKKAIINQLPLQTRVPCFLKWQSSLTKRFWHTGCAHNTRLRKRQRAGGLGSSRSARHQLKTTNIPGEDRKSSHTWFVTRRESQRTYPTASRGLCVRRARVSFARHTFPFIEWVISLAVGARWQKHHSRGTNARWVLPVGSYSFADMKDEVSICKSTLSSHTQIARKRLTFLPFVCQPQWVEISAEH